jgi:hypothetical protein
MIARYGLPHACDINGLQGLIGKHELLFLGDMDPADLLVFAWLREKLDFAQIKYLGVGDKYLDGLKVKIPDSFTMQLCKSELASRPLLEKVCPDFRELVGVRGANLLDGGRKIEIEAVVSAMGTTQILPLI